MEPCKFKKAIADYNQSIPNSIKHKEQIIYDLKKSLRFLVNAAKTEPGMNIYRAHIKQAENLLKWY